MSPTDVLCILSPLDIHALLDLTLSANSPIACVIPTAPSVLTIQENKRGSSEARTDPDIP